MNELFNHKLPVGNFCVYDQCPDNAIIINQTHSNIVVEYQGKNLSQIEADGIIINLEQFDGHIPAIRTADCLPICLLGEKQIVMVHAGWRGIANKVILDDKIRSIAPYYAFIGPSIQEKNFIVTRDFYNHFPKSLNFREKDDRIFFNLQSEVKDQLRELNSKLIIEDCGLCTFDSPKLFSFRRNKGSLRNWNVFQLNNEEKP